MVFRHYKGLWNMTLMMCNNLRHFKAVKRVCSWWYQFTSGKMIVIKETPYEVFSHCSKANHLDKELALSADNMLYKLDKLDKKVKYCGICHEKIGKSFKIPFS